MTTARKKERQPQCPVCLGKGILQSPGDSKQQCHHCHGTGIKPRRNGGLAAAHRRADDREEWPQP
jgi:DnaJ-class molecular chaperone